MEKENTIELLSKDFQIINYQNINSLLTSNTGFLVVGVIGKQGVGKSFILNQLSTEDAPFPVQTLKDIININNKTNGIDFHITRERIILLDVMPILTLPHLALNMEKEKKIKVYSAEDNENDNRIKMSYSPDIVAVQLISFLLSVCHVMIVVDQNLMNYRLLRLIDIAHRLRPWIDCNPEYLLNEESKSGILHTNLHDEFHDYCAQMLFVENNHRTEYQLAEKPKHESNLLQCLKEIMVSYRIRCNEQTLLRSWLKQLKLEAKERDINRRRKRLKRNRDQRADPKSLIQLGQSDLESDIDVEEKPREEENGENELKVDGNDSTDKTIRKTTENQQEEDELNELNNNNTEEEDDEEDDNLEDKSIKDEVVELNEQSHEESNTIESTIDPEVKSLSLSMLEKQLHCSIYRQMDMFHMPIIDGPEELRNSEYAIALQRKVFGYPRKHFSATQNERFTEQCWLEHAVNMWNVIRESMLIKDYFFSLATSLNTDI